MSERNLPRTEHQTSGEDEEFYEIRVKGHLHDHWSDWLEGVTLTNAEDGQAVLFGALRDQAALHGVLIKIRDLGLTLISVNPAKRGAD